MLYIVYMEKDIQAYIKLLQVRKHKAALHDRPEEYTALNKVVRELEALLQPQQLVLPM